MSQELEKKIAHLEAEITNYQTILNTMTVPLIESILHNTLLMPINGHLFNERIELMNAKLFKHLEQRRFIKTVIIDFTGISSANIAIISGKDLTAALKHINSTLQILGIRPIYTGFQPEIAQTFVHFGFQDTIETYPTYRMAIIQLAKEQKIFLNLDPRL